MPDFLTVLREELNRASTGVDYAAGIVTAVQSAAGTVTLSWANGTALGVPYLASYTPAVNDKVHFLVVKTAGLLVLGKTTAVGPGPAASSTRTAFLTPSVSASWYQDTSGDVEYGTVPGNARQGSSITQAYVGYFTYATGQVTLATGEAITQAELLLKRVDAGQGTAAASLHEFTTLSGTGRPVVAAPEREFTGPDQNTGFARWVLIPVSWAQHLVAGSTLGLALQPNGALAAATYSEYAGKDTVVDADTSSGGGRVRLTIAQD